MRTRKRSNSSNSSSMATKPCYSQVFLFFSVREATKHCYSQVFLVFLVFRDPQAWPGGVVERQKTKKLVNSRIW